MARFGARDAQALFAAAAPEQPLGFQFSNGLAHRGAVDAELARQIGLGGQRIARAQRALDDALLDDVRDLPVGRMIVQRLEQVAHLGFPEQLAADQHPAYLRGAGADLVQFGVAQQPPGRIVVDVAVAAEQLNGIERRARGRLGAEQDARGGVLARRVARDRRPRRRCRRSCGRR